MNRDILLIGSTRVKSWHAALLLVFFVGFGMALIWAAYTEQFVPSRGAQLPVQMQIVENTALVAYGDSSGNQYSGESNRVVTSIDQSTGGTVTLSLNPASGSFIEGNLFEVDVILNTDGEVIDGVDLHYLRFDQSRLEVVDSEPNISGVQIRSGDILDITDVNTVNAAAGTIDFSRTTNGGTTFSGIGKIATIVFRALTPGGASLSFDFVPGNTADTNVGAGVGQDILAQVSGAAFVVTQSGGGDTDPRPFTITHKKETRPQGRHNGSFTIRIFRQGTNQLVSEIVGVADTNGRAADLKTSNRLEDGVYDLYLIVPDYLSRALPSVAWPPTAELDFGPVRAGNLQDADDCINSLDWGIMNRDWGKAGVVADMNDDNIVNSVDWSGMNRNWGICGALHTL